MSLNIEIFALAEVRRFRKGHSRRLAQDYGKIDSVRTSELLQVKVPMVFLAMRCFSRYRGGSYRISSDEIKFGFIYSLRA
jgi:hypothetical protein